VKNGFVRAPIAAILKIQIFIIQNGISTYLLLQYSTSLK